MDRKITQIGGSLGVTIPSKIIKKTKFFDGAKVSFRVVNDSSIMITLINSEAEKMGRRAQRRVIKED